MRITICFLFIINLLFLNISYYFYEIYILINSIIPFYKALVPFAMICFTKKIIKKS
jgi:hypothetical protein